MTSQEQQMIEGLISRIQKTAVGDKDIEAEKLLQEGLGRDPDALYLLAQTVLVQGYALEQAQRQLASAKAELDALRQQPKHNTSFLSSIFGGGNEASAQPAPPQPAMTQPQYAPVPGYTQSPGYAPQYGTAYPPPMGGGGGFLRNALQTASGVAAGALAFEGIESLMHGFGHSAGYGESAGFGGIGGGFGGGAPREEIVNNYYGDARPGEHHEPSAGSGDFKSSDTQATDFSSTASDTDNAQNSTLFKEASYDSSQDGDLGSLDDSGDTSGGFGSSDSDSDGGGGFDGGGDDTSF